ncbi:MAG: hypothetical protein ACYC49_00290 [Ignavibacteriaceae bacterium]
MKFMKPLLLLLSMLLCSCFNVGSGTLPSATKGFIPQKTYTLSYNDLWAKVQEVLITERINIASQDKENKRIQTDYLQGSTQASLLGVINTRYKYNIVFDTMGNNSSSIHIMAALESSSKGIEWHDISKDNAHLVHGLESWLYEKIENQLK